MHPYNATAYCCYCYQYLYALAGLVNVEVISVIAVAINSKLWYNPATFKLLHMIIFVVGVSRDICGHV